MDQYKNAHLYQRLMAEQELIQQANKTMARIIQRLRDSGETHFDAQQKAIEQNGASIAKMLEDNLRNMGAGDVRVTCP